MHISDDTWTLTRAGNRRAGGVTLEKQNPLSLACTPLLQHRGQGVLKGQCLLWERKENPGRCDISEMPETQGPISPCRSRGDSF